jgi:hypothetical protein
MRGAARRPWKADLEPEGLEPRTSPKKAAAIDHLDNK